MDSKKILLTSIILSLLFILSLILYSKTYRKIGKMGIVKKPNILLITVCSLRKDHLGCYGYSRLTTPNIDKLAQTSTIFTNCYTHIPWTIPSIKALMTGNYPALSVSIDKEISLTDILRSVGYITFGIVGTFVENSDFNLDFDEFFGPRNLKTSKDINTVSSDVIANKAMEILTLKKVNNVPIFLWLFFKDPHWPYIPPQLYKELFLNDFLYYKQSQILKINDDFHDSLNGIGEARLIDLNGKFINNKAYYISQYDAEIFFLDHNIGKIINYIKTDADFKNWLIILVADHGESLGENQYFFDHGYTLSGSTVKIPLIIKFPGQRKAKVIDELASICDIYPTIAEVVGVNTKETFGSNNSTINLWDKNKWLKTIKIKNRKIILENSPGHEKGKVKLLGCISGSLKLIWNLTNNEKKLYNEDDKQFELYNLKDDPRELNNLVSVEKEKLESLKQKLNEYLKQSQCQNREIKSILDEETKEKLKSLGYAQ